MSNAGTDVKIKLISSIIPVEGDVETYEMWLQGTFIEKAGTPYLRYDEVQEDKKIRTVVKLTGDQSYIMRSGDVSMRLPLNPAQKEHGRYESTYGEIPLVTKTHQLSFQKQDNSGQFKAQYDLIIGGSSVGNYTLEIHFTEVSL